MPQRLDSVPSTTLNYIESGFSINEISIKIIDTL